jgi:excisionase family DNA binding protein
MEPAGGWRSRRGRVKLGYVSSADRDPEALYSVREVAGQLGVHPETIRRLIHDGRLDAVRVGRVLRVHRKAVEGFLARQRIKPTRD